MLNRFFLIIVSLCFSLPTSARDENALPYGSVVIPLVLDQSVADSANWHVDEDILLEVAYFLDPNGTPIAVEPAEKLIWIDTRPVLFLGATGDPLPERIVNRGMAFLRLSYLGQPIGNTIAIYPRKEQMLLNSDSKRMNKALHRMIPGVDASYLAQVAHFLAGNLASLDVQATSISITGVGSVINNLGQWVGPPIQGSQNLFSTIGSDSGSTTADSTTDTLSVVGSGLVSTSISGDSLIIDGTIADDFLDFDFFSDAMTVDAVTSFDLDTNNADLNFDNNSLFIDSSSNRIGIGTNLPTQALDVAGNIHVDGRVTTGSLTIEGSVHTITSSAGTISFDNENLTTTGTTTMGGFNMATGASTGSVLTSDSSGNGTWQEIPVNNNQNLFETIIAPNGTSPVADQPNDNLYFLQAGIVTITGNSNNDTITISATEGDGDSTNELQNVFTTVAGSSGSTTANSRNDTLNIVGSGTISTSIAGDTLTVHGTSGISQRTYDSGWFPVTANVLYTKFHNLGTQKLITKLYFSTNSQGTGMREVPITFNGAITSGGFIRDITTTQLSIISRDRVYAGFSINAQFEDAVSGYWRVMALALD